ncbi:MAG: M48 family metallopeptidase [Bacteroidales bacterium]|nr:M48 family metallopeptidase [Candidatus Egerieousia equi]
MTQLYQHEVIGRVFLKRRINARKITVTLIPEGVNVTFPFLCPLYVVKRFLDENAQRIWDAYVKYAWKYKLDQDRKERRRLEREKTLKATAEMETYGGVSIAETGEFSSSRNIFSYAVPYSELTQEDLKIIRKTARKILKERLDWHVERMNRTIVVEKKGEVVKNPFSYNGLAIKDNSSNLGSCSYMRNINLNMHLVRLPKYLCDYVIVHELCHLVHMDHSRDFYDLLTKALGMDAYKCRRDLHKLEHNFSFLKIRQ